MRLLRRLTILLSLTVIAISSTVRIGDVECLASCEDDGPDGRCPPTCIDCTCCVHSTRIFDTSTHLESNCSLELTGRVISDIEGKPRAPEPQGILKVPIASIG